jgi:hypothetical protein
MARLEHREKFDDDVAVHGQLVPIAENDHGVEELATRVGLDRS